ncbi:hypothetical protein [Saccharothrix yanglingensis]|uniref:Orn/Lys/Arg family decarboxylase n=1 Tax=Saccharothrix yanglingensis TaxID=659496 RepID=UPI0027D312C8|nr:hypothetical protein [Saccharothrix yanglingensis]
MPEASHAFREQGFTPFTPPGHRQGRGVDPACWTPWARRYVIPVSGLDDRLDRPAGHHQPTSLVCATLDGWRRQMVQHGEELLTATLAPAHSTRAAIDDPPGLRVVGEAEFTGPGRTHTLDPLKMVVDVAELGISGYQAADWLREHQRVTVGLSDHRRVVAQFTHADDHRTAGVLPDAPGALTKAAQDMSAPPPVDLPTPDELQPETAIPPRDAFFAEVEQVPADQAVGRICAGMVTPYPPGAPAVLPGEVITEAVVDSVRGGLGAGMELPDPADPELKSFRVVDRSR